MKKFGFTLSELLIAMTIIAVASVLVMPYLNNIMPDKYKARVLKYYAVIKKTTDDLLENETIYYPSKSIDPNDGTIVEGDVNLTCDETPIYTFTDSTLYNGINKYPNLMRKMIFSDVNPNNSVTPDGAKWTISAVDTTDIDKGYLITIDMNGTASGPNCAYSTESTAPDACKKRPDTFTFKVNKYGDITPNDPLTAVFLRNPSKTSKKEDFEEASNTALFIYGDAADDADDDASGETGDDD